MDDFQIEPQDIEPDVSESATDEVIADTPAVDENTPSEEVSQEQKVSFDEAQQAKVNSLISDKVAKTHEERRLREDAEQRLADFQAQMPKPQEPTVPDLPDPDEFYGDPTGYNAKLHARDTAIQERAEFDARNRLIQDQQQYQTRQREHEVALKQQAAIEGYSKAAESFGITGDQMQKDAATVMQIGIPSELSDHLVNDAQGPLVTNFLANNLLEAEKLRTMTPLEAAVYVATEIKPKLTGARKLTKAPAPANIVGGGGAPSKDNPLLDGVTFE